MNRYTEIEASELEGAGVAYVCCWSQEGFPGTVSGKRIYTDLAEITEFCDDINFQWKGQITQWPEKVFLDAQGKVIPVKRGRRLRAHDPPSSQA